MLSRSDVPPPHVVWDWNGTLLDDFAVTARIARHTLETLGVPGVDAEAIRAHFRRPYADFYARLFGRPITAAEYDLIRQRYELEYGAEALALSLQPDAGTAMDVVAENDATQSLLSMAHDEQLQELVDHHRIRDRFLRVDGSPSTDSDGNKSARLASHLAAMGVGATSTVVIGDTVDDHEAAASCGARSVLVTTGSTARSSLEETGAHVVDTLLAAARIAVGVT